MSGDLLREAAAVLRLGAEVATPGSWTRDSNAVRPSARWWDAVALTHGPRSLLDAAYIATMHPGVGLAVAGWLEAEADLAADPRNHAEVLKEALAVALAILGRQS